MITVHHLENSRSQRVLWLLEELGLDYEVQRYDRDPETMLAPDSLRRVHPLGKSPVITDDERTVAETGAIIEYLVDWCAGGRLAPPPGTEERLRYTYWLHYAEGSAMPPLLMKLVFDRLPALAPFWVRPVARGIAGGVKAQFVQPRLDEQLDFMESQLPEGGWFAGDELTAADVQMSFPLEAAAARGGLDERRPALHDFLERIHARPAYKRALERGGPYRIPGS